MATEYSKAPRILIIEDDPVSRNILKNIFVNEGYQVLEEGDGTKGLETALSVLPDLICLDIILPGLSGYEVCRSIRADDAGADIPILMITALTKREDIVKGLRTGATDYLTKPFSQIEVLARVKVNLQQRVALRDLLERTGQFALACDVLEALLQPLGVPRADLFEFPDGNANEPRGFVAFHLLPLHLAALPGDALPH